MGALELPADTALPEGSEIPDHLRKLLFMRVCSPTLFFCQVKWLLGYVLSAYGLVLYFSGSQDAFLGL